VFFANFTQKFAKKDKKITKKTVFFKKVGVVGVKLRKTA